jgi:hypothetical protein
MESYEPEIQEEEEHEMTYEEYLIQCCRFNDLDDLKTCLVDYKIDPNSVDSRKNTGLRNFYLTNK